MNSKDIFQDISNISIKLNLPVYAVGGFVRDSFMNRPLKKDIDFVVDGSGLAFAQAFAKYLGEENCSLIEFSDFDTARVVYLTRTQGEQKNGEFAEEVEHLFEVEFAGARKETYTSDSRKPEVVATTIEEDLSRRDFTVNAMARQILTGGELGPVLDPFNGMDDLEDKTLKTPLDPDETFIDDPLRMMRAVRFASQLQFSIDPETLKSIHKNKERLNIISKERIQEELMKVLATEKPSVGLWLLHGTRLFDEFLPEVELLSGVEEVKGYSHKDNLSHTFAVVDNVAEQSSKLLLRFAALMHDIAKPQTKKFEKGRGWTFDMHEHLGRKMCKDIMQRLKFSRQDMFYVSELVRWHLQPIALMDDGVTDSPVRRLIVNLEHRLPDLLMLCRADITTGNQKRKEHRLKNYDILEKRIAEVIESDNLRAFTSPFRGEEIMAAAGLKPGPTVGKMKVAIEEAILDGLIPNEHDAAAGYFETIKEKYLEEASDWELV